MSRASGNDSILGLRSPRSIAAVAVVVALVLASAGFPLGKARRNAPDPTAKANLAYRQLQEQMGLAPAAPEAAGDRRGDASEAPAAGPLQRDLFSRSWQPVAPRAPGAAPVAPAGPPALSAIFIDGPTRVAILGGVRVREGDRVAGYRVMSIRPEGVRLRKGDTVVRLPWGDNR